MAGKVKRGEVWLVNLEPSMHREIHKKRPALVISTNAVNTNTFHTIVIPISSQVPKIVGPEMVVVGRREGLDKSSVVLPLFIRSVDQKRLVKRIGKISKVKLAEVEEAMKLILELT